MSPETPDSRRPDPSPDSSSDSPRDSRRPRAHRRAPFALGLGGSLALLAALCFAGALLWTRTRGAQLSRELDAEVTAFRALQWARPAPRGGELEGDAADAQRAALAALGPLDANLTSQLGPVLRGERPATPELEAMVSAHAAALATLRESVRRRHAHTPFVCSPAGPASHNTRAHLAAVKSVLFLGERSGPGECLRAGADAIRLGHDMVPGGGLLPLMVSVAEVELAIPVVLRCAAHASPGEAAEAAEAFERLAATPPPVGDAYEAEFLAISCMLRGALRAAPVIPSGGEHGALERPLLVAAWDAFAHDLAGWRALRGEDYPAAAAVFHRRYDALASTRNPVLQNILPNYDRYLERDMTAQARVRALAVVLHALATPSATPSSGPPLAAPPPAAEHPALRDPYTGRALRWLVAPDGTLSVYSVGRNGRDERGAPGADDVGVNFLPPARSDAVAAGPH